jgi:uncharacterized protein YecT (DUF1311 family)
MRYFSNPLNDLNLKKIILIITLFFSGIIAFGQTQSEMNQEAFAAYQKADSEMTIVYKKVLKKLTDPKQKQDLIQAQRNWIKYKEAHCKAIADLYQGGSMQGMVHSYCLETLTNERKKNLETYFEND